MIDIDFTDNSEAILSALHAQMQEVCDKIGCDIEGAAKELAPVGTPESTKIPGYVGGTLRNSISHETDCDTVYIGTNVTYAPYVEMGTVKMKAKPYLRPAVQDNRDLITKRVNEGLEKVLGGF